MAERIHPSPTRPAKFEDRYRVYLDESGDHVFRETDELPPGICVSWAAGSATRSILNFTKQSKRSKPSIFRIILTIR
jgi:hypothetical protein